MPKKLPKALLKRIVAKITTAPTPKYKWDPSDQLTDQQISRILALPDGFDDVKEEVGRFHAHFFYELEQDYVRRLLRPFIPDIAKRLDIDAEDLTEDLLDAVIDDYRLLEASHGVDPDIWTLVCNTCPRAVVLMKLYHEHAADEWRDNLNYDDVAPVLELFNINPRNILERFPNIASREGQEYILPADLIKLWDNVQFCGQYVLPVKLDLAEFIKHRKEYYSKVILRKGTPILIHDYLMGGKSVAIILQRNLVISRHFINYTFADDNDCLGYALKDLYAPRQIRWNVPISYMADDEAFGQAILPPAYVAQRFRFETALTDFQTSAFVTAYNRQMLCPGMDVVEAGKLMESDIEFNLWSDFPYEGKKFLRTSANKSNRHLAVRFSEKIGQVEILHCQFLVDEDSKIVAWSKVDPSIRSQRIFQFMKLNIEMP